MRRQWYLGFGILLVTFFMVLQMLHDARWFLVYMLPLCFIGLYDLIQKKHAILRNFPILGHSRYILEFFRPEIQQYFIANDEEERPFNRETRTIIYQRAKNVRDTIPFGTEQDIFAVGYTWVRHSIAPKAAHEVVKSIMVGGPDCKRPYHASRLNISALSFGAISANAIMALNQGAKMGGFAHNTGEGGLSPYHLQGGDIIFQMGTAYFGCRTDEGAFSPDLFKAIAELDEVKMIEIKLSQGAKPAHGGILPKGKVTPEIAKVRKVPLGKDIVSPVAHSEFSTPRELLFFIQRIRELALGKPVGFKLCIGHKKEFFGICKAMLETNILPDFITVDGAEGGSGAAPLEFCNRVGEPLEAGLVFVRNALTGTNLRDKIRIICSGKVATGFDIVEKIALGADMCNVGRAMMMAVGCVQSKQCNANTCPTGVATQSKRLQNGLVVDDKKHHVVNFHDNTIKSFLEIVGAMGLSSPSELRPYHLFRRVEQQVVKPIDDIYLFIKPGSLLGDNIPEYYRKEWELANPDRF